LSPANVFIQSIGIPTPGPLASFASVVARPQGGQNCGGSGQEPFTNTVSAGDNFSDDATCGFAGDGDRQNAGDPQLGALAANGGPTPTRLPATTSPLLGAVPVDRCQADGAAGVTTDQRGVTRPQGPACDTGSVEVMEAPVAKVVTIQPRFTG
jgi:hypothetical protein